MTETFAPQRPFDESKVIRGRGGKFAPKPGSGGPQATTVPKKKKAPAAHVYSAHANGDVTHVSTDSSRRLVYNANSKKFDVQERQDDGTWSTTSTLSKTNAYKEAKSGVWQTADSGESDVSVAQSTVTPEVAPAPETTAPPVQPTPVATAGASIKPTASLIYGKHPDGAVLFTSEDGNQRVVWDGKSRKFLTQSRTDDGWETTEALGKGAAYQRFKGTSGWVTPTAGETAPVPESLPKEPAAVAEVSAESDVVGPISTPAGQLAVGLVPPDVAPTIDAVETPTGTVSGYSEVVDEVTTPLTATSAIQGPVPVIVANGPDATPTLANVDFTVLRASATADEIAAAETLNSGKKLTTGATAQNLAGAVADWTGADYPKHPTRSVGTTEFHGALTQALSGEGSQSTTAVSFVRAVAAAPPNAPEITRGMTNVPLHLIGEPGDIIAMGPSSFTADPRVSGRDPGSTMNFGTLSYDIKQALKNGDDLSELNEVIVTVPPGSRSLGVGQHAGDYQWQDEWVTMGQFRVVSRREEVVTRRVHHGSLKNFTDYQFTRYHVEIEQVA